MRYATVCSGINAPAMAWNSLGWQEEGPPNLIQSGMAVRRLTPRECERLQGFPDDWTLVSVRGKDAADSPRYKALGNSMACNVMRWLGQRIEMADGLPGTESAKAETTL